MRAACGFKAYVWPLASSAGNSVISVTSVSQSSVINTLHRKPVLGHLTGTYRVACAGGYLAMSHLMFWAMKLTNLGASNGMFYLSTITFYKSKKE